MQTPDRTWRVEIIRRRGQRTRWYRVVGAGRQPAEWLSIAAVERILADAGVEIASLVPVASGVNASEPSSAGGWTGAPPRTLSA